MITYAALVVENLSMGMTDSQWKYMQLESVRTPYDHSTKRKIREQGISGESSPYPEAHSMVLEGQAR